MSADEVITVHEFVDKNGKSPYQDWLMSLRDARARAKIIIQVDRMELGNFGDSEPVGDGISELRIHFGAGYRVYYAKDGKNIYLLLCGGNKKTQKKDIVKAKEIWVEHKQV